MGFNIKMHGNHIVKTGFGNRLGSKWDLHSEAFSHGALIEGLGVHLDDDLVQGPCLRDGVVAVAGRFLSRKVVQIKAGPRVDP